MAAPAHDTLVWHNGRLIRAHHARISPFDQGLTVGLGAFETLVAHNGEPFAFSRHWQRLTQSCRGLDLPLPDRNAILPALREVAAANGHPQGRLRITVTAGAGPLGSGRTAIPQPTCLVVSAPRPIWPPVASLTLVNWPKNEHSPLAGLKSTSYAENSLALAQARRRDADEALFPNTQGHLCEGTGSNFFLVHRGELLTPPLSDGCLGGITRALVLEIARNLGLPVREQSLPLTSLSLASEAFLTSTTRDVQPVGRIDATHLPHAPGPVTLQLQTAWHQLLSHQLDP